MLQTISINTKKTRNRYDTCDIYRLLHDWVVKKDAKGYVTRVWDVAEIVHQIYAYTAPKGIGQYNYNKQKRGERIDVKWVKRFTGIFDDLYFDAPSGYVIVRDKADDISSVKAFFRQLHTNLTTLNPLKHNVYSVSESSFQWDPVASLTSNDAKLTIDFNDDYVTVFECINGEGNSLPPFMGPFDVQNHGDFKAFPKGWTRDKLRLEWLRYFIRLTNGNNKPQRFLIVDEHKGRPTEKFKTLCQENNVVLVCIPSTVWYHFVKLDVGASRAIKQFHRDRIGSISSIACLVEKYVKARSEALTRLSIRRKFCCTGLIEFNPERILNNLSPLKTCGNVDSDLEEIVTGPKEAENSVKEIDSGPKEAEDSVEEIYSGPEQIQDSDPEAVRDSDLEEIEYSDIAEIQHPDPISGPIQEQDPPCAEMDGETLSFPQKLHFIDPLAPCTHAKEPPLLQSVDGPTLNYQYPLENENISSNKEQAKPTQTFPRLHPNTNIQFFHHCDSETNY